MIKCTGENHQAGRRESHQNNNHQVDHVVPCTATSPHCTVLPHSCKHVFPRTVATCNNNTRNKPTNIVTHEINNVYLVSYRLTELDCSAIRYTGWPMGFLAVGLSRGQRACWSASLADANVLELSC